MRRFLRPHWLLWGLLPVFLWWAWRDIAWAQVADLLQKLPGWRIMAWLGVNTGITVLFSLRWWLILASFGYKVPYMKLAGYRLAGFAISFLTPGPQFGGEPVQVVALTRKEHIPAPAALASVVLEKSVELLSSFMFLVFGLLVILQGGLRLEASMPGLILALISLALLPVSYLGLLWLGKRPLTSLLQAAGRMGWAARRITTWAVTAQQAENQAADFYRCQPGLFSVVLFQSLLLWALLVFEYWLSLGLLGLWLPVSQVIFLLVAARLAMLLPAPGGLGPMEASQVLAARALQFDPAFAVSLTLLARTRDILLVGLGAALAANLVSNTLGQPLPTLAENKLISLPEVKNETGG